MQSISTQLVKHALGEALSSASSEANGSNT
jgi:hypothetical protein